MLSEVRTAARTIIYYCAREICEPTLRGKLAAGLLRVGRGRLGPAPRGYDLDGGFRRCGSGDSAAEQDVRYGGKSQEVESFFEGLLTHCVFRANGSRLQNRVLSATEP